MEKLRLKVEKQDTKKYKVDDKVFLVKSNITELRHGITANMTKMIGNQYRIEKIYYTADGDPYYYINGYNWAGEDLSYKETDIDIFLKRSKKELFDISLIEGV